MLYCRKYAKHAPRNRLVRHTWTRVLSPRYVTLAKNSHTVFFRIPHPLCSKLCMSWHLLGTFFAMALARLFFAMALARHFFAMALARHFFAMALARHFFAMALARHRTDMKWPCVW